MILLCLVGAAAAVRRMVALSAPAVNSRAPALQDLDARFAIKAGLTYVHITAGLLFVGLVPLQLVSSLRDRMPRRHRIVGRVLLAVGSVAIAFPMVLRNPVSGVNEAGATIFIASLFLFSLGKAFWFIRHRNAALHREFMIRAVAIALGIAPTRPIMGAFFATASLTHLTPQQFFGTAFWLGFSINYVFAEAGLSCTRVEIHQTLTGASR
jgi:uncharacterized membrane protein YozB (DUF420 family)